MSQGTFLDTLIRLEAFKRIFAFRPKIDFFQGLGLGLGLGLKRLSFASSLFVPKHESQGSPSTQIMS